MDESLKIAAESSVPSSAAARWRLVANTRWHAPLLQLYAAVVLLHWMEHLAQALQVYVLGWPLPQARGVLGHWFPWLVASEALHYAYAAVMLAGLWYLRPGFRGQARRWWTIALVIQFWHHMEHALLQIQVLVGHHLGGGPAPVSILQLWAPRLELHLFYNTVVFVPMLVGVYHHLVPSPADAAQMSCGCSVHRARSVPS